MALESFKRRGVTGLIESTEGVDATPANTDGVLLYNGVFKTEVETQALEEDRAFFSNNEQTITQRRAVMEGDFMVVAPTVPGHASATGNHDANIILFPAGMTAVKNAGAKTTRLNPISAAIPSATYYIWHNDRHVKMLGARNAITGLRAAIGSRFMGRVQSLGTYTTVEKSAIPSITKPTRRAPVARWNNSSQIVTVNGGLDITLEAKELSVDFGTALANSEWTGANYNGITDRLATWSLLVSKGDLAVFNPENTRDAQHIVTARFRTQYATPGLFCELGIRGQITAVESVEIQGWHGFRISGPCIATDAGGDEFYILSGDTTP